jgi:hypothetical protein
MQINILSTKMFVAVQNVVASGRAVQISIFIQSRFCDRAVSGGIEAATAATFKNI